ncbi:vacuolar ATPase assembly integral membrane protein vma21 [Tyrophagus putrescentiae]|nr:vacuolar ATPase assembly integral membrane protein vma21 [Tyrophagus putrescentiae]
MTPIRKLVVYSMAMIVLPLASYFISNSVLAARWTTDHWANIYAAIIAVLVVHVVLFSFVYQAYSDDQIAEKAELQGKKAD